MLASLEAKLTSAADSHGDFGASFSSIAAAAVQAGVVGVEALAADGGREHEGAPEVVRATGRPITREEMARLEAARGSSAGSSGGMATSRRRRCCKRRRAAW